MQTLLESLSARIENIRLYTEIGKQHCEDCLVIFDSSKHSIYGIYAAELCTKRQDAMIVCLCYRETHSVLLASTQVILDSGYECVLVKCCSLEEYSNLEISKHVLAWSTEAPL